MELYRKISLILAVFIGIFIFYISSLSSPPNPLPNSIYLPIIYHYSVFFIFTFLLLFAGKFNSEFVFVILVVSFLYAGLDELHQFFVPGRDPSFQDFLLDSAGSFTSFLVLGFRNMIGSKIR